MAGTWGLDGSPTTLGSTWAPSPARMRVAYLLGGLVLLPGGAVYLVARVLSTPLSPAPVCLVAAEVIFYCYLCLSCACALRYRAVAAPPPPPPLALDVLIPTLGEPLPMLRRTIEAALAIEHPHRTYVLNDRRIAGRADWQEVDSLAADLGAECVTRTDGPRNKAANLNAGLAVAGGDAVLVLDADNVAHPFAGEILGGLSDPDVGFSASPQAFALTGPDVFNSRDAVFHATFQGCRHADGVVLSTGNGVVYRRAALDAIGGFDDTALLEDITVTVDLHLAGWRSTYHPRPVAVGTAPETAPGLLRQRLKWSGGTFEALLRRRPWRSPQLTVWQRLQYLHNLGAYLSGAVGFGLLLVGLTLAQVLPGTPPASVSPVLAVTSPIFLGATFGVLALVAGPVGGIRTVSQSAFLAPTYLIAGVEAMRGTLRPSASARPGERVRSWLYAPPLVVMGILVGGLAVRVVGDDASDPVIGFAFFFAFLLAGPVTAGSRNPAVNRAARTAVRVALTVGVVALLVR